MQAALVVQYMTEKPIHAADIALGYASAEHTQTWIRPRQEPIYLIYLTIAELKDAALRCVQEVIERVWADDTTYFINATLFLGMLPGGTAWNGMSDSGIRGCTKKDLTLLTGEQFFFSVFSLPPPNPEKSE